MWFGRQSIIPYIHGRDGCCIVVCLLKSRLGLLEVSLVWSWSSKEHVRIRCLPDPFIAQGQVVTLRYRARQVAPRWLKPYTTSRVLLARSS
jgi:hypothetical protein